MSQPHSHTHDHPHGDHDQHPHDAQAIFAKANAEHYDTDKAKKYDNNPFFQRFGKNIAETITKVYPFDKESTKVLDYACGTGLVSRELAPHVKSILGVDISSAAVEIFNARAVEKGFEPDTLRAIAKMLKGDEGELQNEKFDVILCTMAYHHFPDILESTRILASHLKPTGTLIIVDNCPAEPDATALPVDVASDLEIKKIITETAKQGFTREIIETTFAKSGLAGGFKYIGPAMEPMMWPKKGEDGAEGLPEAMLGLTLKVFLAMGSKEEGKKGE